MPPCRRYHWQENEVPTTWLSCLTPWRRRNGRRFRRKREAYIFANQVQIALIGVAVFREPLADLLDQNFRRRSTGGQANAVDAFQPRRIDVGSGINQLGFDTATLCNLDQAAGIGNILPTPPQNKVN